MASNENSPVAFSEVIKADLSPTSRRKDPNEEFFLMTLLSYKLNHKNIDKILAVDGKQMYEEAVKQNVPFYNWNDWV